MKVKKKLITFIVYLFVAVCFRLLIGSMILGFAVSGFSFFISKYAKVNGDSIIFSKRNFVGIVVPVFLLFFFGIIAILFIKDQVYSWLFKTIIFICFGSTKGVLYQNILNFIYKALWFIGYWCKEKSRQNSSVLSAFLYYKLF